MMCAWERPLFETVAAAVLAMLVSSGCGGGGEGPGDAGEGEGGSVCASDSECDDGEFCNGAERCDPDNPAAGMDGCAPASEPACPDTSCDEATDSCVDDCPDADGDGHRDLACGGDDCDDSDANRFPGNAEVCDADGHDEDCDDTTLGGTDADSDGVVSDECCNGDTCGGDCDDGSSSIEPNASEICDGVDQDCDGTVDEAGDDVLCPGGVCVAGRCRLDHWDRTLGGTGREYAKDAAMDAEGNVYVVGTFTETVRFGTDMETAEGASDGFVISYAGDGSYRWHHVFGGSLIDQARGISVGADGGVYVVGDVSGEADLGGGTRSAGDGRGYVLAMTTDGAYEWDVLGGAAFRSVVAVRGGVVAGGGFSSDEDFGGGLRSADSSVTGVVVRYSEDGTHTWDTTFAGDPSSWIGAYGVDSADVTIAVGGRYAGGSLTIDGTTYPEEGSSSIFVAALDADDGSIAWHQGYSATNTMELDGTAITPSGSIYAVGQYSGDLDLGGGSSGSGPGTYAGFVLGLRSDGSYEWHRLLTGPEAASAVDCVPTADDGIAVLGEFDMGTLDLGGGPRSTSSYASFTVNYAEDGTYRNDTVYESSNDLRIAGLAVGPGGSTAYVGSFEGTVDLGSGDRVSSGNSDAFIVRPGS